MTPSPWPRMLRDTAPEELPALAVLVLLPVDHCGVLYEAEGRRAMLHLAWHKHLSVDDVPSHRTDKYAWVAPNLPRERGLAVAAICRRVWRRNQQRGIPYGLRYDATTFHRTGELMLGRDELGLTCATFVLALFRQGGVELLRLEEWPARPDDLDRQRDLVARLRSDPTVPREHCDAIEREIGTIRYRPTEVAGACASADLPCSFADASRAAAHIADVFEAARRA
ncbi:MAG: hypothetical protein U0324_32750 [Polyangiales bacterium]